MVLDFCSVFHARLELLSMETRVLRPALQEPFLTQPPWRVNVQLLVTS
jgi:hypothetical protein